MEKEENSPSHRFDCSKEHSKRYEEKKGSLSQTNRKAKFMIILVCTF